jgi:hypothetical protein
VDLRELRSHLGLVNAGQRLLDGENATAYTVVLTGHTGTVLVAAARNLPELWCVLSNEGERLRK